MCVEGHFEGQWNVISAGSNTRKTFFELCNVVTLYNGIPYTGQ